MLLHVGLLEIVCRDFWTPRCKLFASTKAQELSQSRGQLSYLVPQLATVLLFDKHRLCLLRLNVSHVYSKPLLPMLQ